MVDAARGVASFLVFLAYLAGFTSSCSSLISAANSQARIIFNSGREGLLPSVTYLVANLALPVYFRRVHRDQLSPPSPTSCCRCSARSRSDTRCTS